MTDSSAPPILLSTSTFPLRRDGSIPQFIFDLAKGLADHFPEVHVSAPGDAAAAPDEDMEGVCVHRFSYAWPNRLQVLCYRSGILTNIQRNPLTALLVPQFFAAQVWATIRLCRRHRFPVINSHWLVTQGLAAALARSITPFRHVAHVHAADLYLLRRLRLKLGRCIARFIVARCDLVVCESRYVHAELNKLLGRPVDAVVSPMGVDSARFARGGGGGRPHRLLYFGRLVEKKGVQYLIQAMRLVRERIPEAVLTIAGSGALEKNLQQLSGELGLLDSAVRFAGAKNHDEIIELLRDTRVVVVPSIIDSHGETEGMPTVVLEALAAGKRVVASDVDGVPDVLRHGENGWLAVPADAGDLADKIVAALLDTGSAVLEAARQTALAYDWREICKRYAALLAPPSPQCRP